MQKFMSDYLDTVCGAVRGKALKQATRVELADHMKERFEDLLEEGLGEEAAALETIKRMGDPETLGKRITKANYSPIGLISIFCGLILLVGAFIVTGKVLSVEFIWFIDFNALFFVVVLSAAYGFMCERGKPTWISLLRGAKTGALYAGGILCIMAMAAMFQSMADDPASIGYKLGTSLISPLYGLLLSAGARVAEKRLTIPEAGEIKGLLE